jgi:regulator of microtubule dynamics RMD1/3-like protein
MKTKRLFFIISVAVFPCLLRAQNVNDIIKQAQQIEASMNDIQAVNKYKEALNLDPSNIYLLCKCSELCSRIGGRLKDDNIKQEDFYTAARAYASTALRLSPLNSEANFVMALVMGRDAIRKGGKEKIEAVKDIKKYADLSIRYNSQNYKAWYVLGKWYYELNNLNYFERTAVKIFYGALPSASIEDALTCFEKVKLINPDFILNYLSLAKAYKKKDEENIAKENLMAMFNLPDKMQDDEKIKSDGRNLLKEWE